MAFAAMLAAAGLSRPANPTATASSEIKIDLSWQDTSSNETGFEVRRSSTGPDGTFAVLASTAANITRYGDAGLNASTRYCYKVRSYRIGNGKTTYSELSVPACATTFPPATPAAPSNVHAVPASDSQIHVDWQDNSSNETGFEIHRSVDGPAGAFVLLASTGAGVIARSDSALNPSTEYCYKVRAFNTIGGKTSSSDFSASACATTLAPLPPAAPSGTRVYTVSSSSIAVYWLDNSTSETGFEIHRSADGPAGTFVLAVSPGANATEAMSFGLNASTQYCYKVRAVRTGGGTAAYSEFSNTACATTSPPPAPPGLHVKTVTTGVDLDADGYQATVWADWGWAWVYFGTVALPVNGTITVPGLNPGSDYVVEFSGAASNCDLNSRNPQTVYLGMLWDPGVVVEFDLTCAPPTQLAFATMTDGNAEIYVIKSNGTAGARLTLDPASDSAPAWSPDGTKIAFQSDRSGAAEIWVMDADGSNPVQLTATGGSFRPSWAPDANRIAFSSTRDGNSEIYTINLDGTGLVNLTNDPSDDAEPAWSPDGTKIAFRKGYQIHLMSSDGSGVALLSADPYVADAQPAWSPDGGSLLVSRFFCADLCPTTIWLMSPVDGSAWALTAENPDCETHTDPTWSPDGRNIAFTATDFCSGITTVNFVSGYLTSGVPITEGFKPSWRP